VTLCKFGEEYLKKARARPLGTPVLEALQIIKKHLYPKAQLPQEPLVVREISQEEAISDSHIGPGRGGVCLLSGEIVLVKGLWCLKVPIHETLHKISSVRNLEEALILRPLFEGLAECLTGYLLHRSYEHVYSKCWRPDSKEFLCHKSYEANCRLWGAFFHFVPIESIIPLYFEFPADWKRMCETFADRVNQNGYKAFRDVLGGILSSSPPVTDQTFRNECEDVFGKRFTVYCRTPLALDFSNVIRLS